MTIQTEIALARTAVLDAFDDLCDLTRVFSDAFRQTADWPAQLDPALAVDDPRDAALNLWTDYFFHDDQAPTDTRRALGIVAVPPAVAAAAEALNASKLRFRSAVVHLRKLSESAVDDTLRAAPDHRRNPAVARLLERNLVARLHLLQTYRQLVILPTDTRKVAWSQANGIVRRRLTPAEAENRLIQQFGPGSEEMIAALQRIPPGMAPVETRPGVKHWRANAWINDRRRQVKAHMPLLVVRETPDEPLPEHNLLVLDRPARVRRPRRDRRTEPEPIAPGVYLVRHP